LSCDESVRLGLDVLTRAERQTGLGIKTDLRLMLFHAWVEKRWLGGVLEGS